VQASAICHLPKPKQTKSIRAVFEALGYVVFAFGERKIDRQFGIGLSTNKVIIDNADVDHPTSSRVSVFKTYPFQNFIHIFLADKATKRQTE